MRKWFPNSFESLCYKKAFYKKYFIFFNILKRFFKLKSVQMVKILCFIPLYPKKSADFYRDWCLKLFFYIKRWVLALVECTKNIFFLLTFLGHVLAILAWSKCRLITKHVLFSTHFHSCFFLTFPLKYYLYKRFQLSNKENSLLIYTLMGMIQFWRSIHLSFQSPQMYTLSAGLGMAWNRDGLSCNVKEEGQIE